MPVLVDNTFCTPYLQNPLLLGADIVLHSATKYIGGHGDTVAGILVGKADWILRARMETLRDVGGCISPFNAWLLLRGLKTLPVRMDRHMDNAMEVAHFLSFHPKVDEVIYPGLKTHPAARTGAPAAARSRRHDQLHGQGRPRGGPHRHGQRETLHAGRQPRRRRHPDRAPGHHDPFDLRESELLKVGIDPAMVRLSVGLENVEDIIADLRQALALV